MFCSKLVDKNPQNGIMTIFGRTYPRNCFYKKNY